MEGAGATGRSRASGTDQLQDGVAIASEARQYLPVPLARPSPSFRFSFSPGRRPLEYDPGTPGARQPCNDASIRPLGTESGSRRGREAACATTHAQPASLISCTSANSSERQHGQAQGRNQRFRFGAEKKDSFSTLTIWLPKGAPPPPGFAAMRHRTADHVAMFPQLYCLHCSTATEHLRCLFMQPHGRSDSRQSGPPNASGGSVCGACLPPPPTPLQRL